MTKDTEKLIAISVSQESERSGGESFDQPCFNEIHGRRTLPSPFVLRADAPHMVCETSAGAGLNYRIIKQIRRT